MARAAHPDDARAALLAWAERRDALERDRRALQRDLHDVVSGAREAGLPVTEIARLTAVSRQTIYSVPGLI